MSNVNMSKYYKKHKRSVRCPFCGSKMEFHLHYSYDTAASLWYCSICACMLPDLADYNHEYLKRIRQRRRKHLKDTIHDLEQELEAVKNQLAAYGKFMSEKEKLRLLAEELEAGDM